MPGNDQYSLPNSNVYLNEQIARANVILPAAGAWDPAPVELQCVAFDSFTLYFLYTPDGAGAGNAFDIYVEISRDGSVWYQTTIYAGGAVGGASDVVSRFQREIFRYAATQQVVPEFSVFGPVAMNGSPDYIRIFAREIGDLVNPGLLEIRISFK